MTKDEKFIQWLKITIAILAFGFFVKFATDVISLLRIISNKP